MRITTKFRINTIFSVIMILLIGLTEFVTFQHVSSVLQKSGSVDQIVRNAFELNLVTYEYLWEHSERSLTQWHLRHDALSELIGNIKFETRAEQFLFDKIKHNHDNMKTIFPLLVENFQSQKNPDETGQKNPDETERFSEFQERFSSQLLVKSQNIITSAEQLNIISRREVSAAQRNTGWIVLSTVFVIALIIAVNSALIGRGIAKPIEKLCEGAEIIGKGDLSYKIATATKDEIGDLSRVFDQMTENLAVITVSRDKLTEEVNERKRAEQELRKARNELMQANEQISAALREKEVLLREVHHRVKNNMQVISSLLDTQCIHAEDERTLKLFRESRDRVRAMSLVHEKLYQSDNLSDIGFKAYLDDLTNTLFKSYEISNNRIRLKTDIEDISLGIDIAIPCGLILNELISNSLKYAFPEDRSGEIRISLCSGEDDEIELTVSDNGVGIPEDSDINNSSSLGLKLVRGFAEHQLDGELELNRDRGTEFIIKFQNER